MSNVEHTEYWKNLSLENIKYVNPETEKHEIEEWRDVVGYEGLYQVSNCGRVKVVICSKKVIKQFINNKGRLVVSLLDLGRNQKTHSVHRLVGIAFVQNPDNKPQVNHIDGVATNNVKWNLEWNTNGENGRHARRIGICKQIAETASSAKLTNSQVLDIFKSNLKQSELCLKYGLSSCCVSNIKTGRKWSSVTGKAYHRKWICLPKVQKKESVPISIKIPKKLIKKTALNFEQPIIRFEINRELVITTINNCLHKTANGDIIVPEFYKNLDIHDVVYEDEKTGEIKTEQWLPVKGYENIYDVSDLGRIKSLNRLTSGDYFVSYKIKEKILKQYCGSYLSVSLSKGENKKTHWVHKLVANSFLPNPENKPTVNHVYGIKVDNRACSLEWNTHLENSNHSFTVLNKTFPSGKYSKKSIPILCKTNGLTYHSMKHAAMELKISKTCVKEVCNGKRKSTKGYEFEIL